MLVARKEKICDKNTGSMQAGLEGLAYYLLLPARLNNPAFKNGVGGIFTSQNLQIMGISDNSKLNLTGVLKAGQDLYIIGENAEVQQSQYVEARQVATEHSKKRWFHRTYWVEYRTTYVTYSNNYSGILLANNKVIINLNKDFRMRGGYIAGYQGVELESNNIELRPNVDVRLEHFSSKSSSLIKSDKISTYLERYDIKELHIFALNNKIKIKANGKLTAQATKMLGKQIELLVGHDLNLIPMIKEEYNGRCYSRHGCFKTSWQESYREKGAVNSFIAYQDNLIIEVNGKITDIGSQLAGNNIIMQANQGIEQRYYNLQHKINFKKHGLRSVEWISGSLQNHTLQPTMLSNNDIKISSSNRDIVLAGGHYLAKNNMEIIAKKGAVKLLASWRQHNITSKLIKFNINHTGKSALTSLLAGDIKGAIHNTIQEIAPLVSSWLELAKSSSDEEIISNSLYAASKLYSSYQNLAAVQDNINMLDMVKPQMELQVSGRISSKLIVLVSILI